MVELSTKPHPPIYQPLDVDRHEIRLLHLQSGKAKAPLKCRMHVVSLAAGEGANPPVYDALSYIWGSSKSSSTENRTVTIQVESASYEMPVTNNLHAALRNMRPRKCHPMVLLVDADCINQVDLQEKNA